MVTSFAPLDALRRIAFLLERSRGETRKVEAFRKAAGVVLTTDEGELRARADAGTLTDLPSIGASTARVISQALEGVVPDYLAKLDDGPLVEETPASRALAEQVRGDLHSHSDWSDGGSPIEEMVATCLELGREYQALTDHSPRLKVANGLTAERLAAQLVVVDRINTHLAGEFTLLKGIEVDILDDGALDQDESMLERLDVVVASVHSKLRMAKGPMTRRMIAAVENPRVDVLGHCTGRLVTGGRGTRAQSEFDAAAVFAACAQHQVAVEINARPERCDPPDDLIGLALDAGCLFSIDTDAHAPGQLDFLTYGIERASRLGVPSERIVTTWPLADLLSWTNRND